MAARARVAAGEGRSAAGKLPGQSSRRRLALVDVEVMLEASATRRVDAINIVLAVSISPGGSLSSVW